MAQGIQARPLKFKQKSAGPGDQPKLFKTALSPNRITMSTSEKKVAVSADMMNTITVVNNTSRREGHTTLATSARTCWMN